MKEQKKKKDKRILIFNGNVLETNSVFKSYQEAEAYVKENSKEDKSLKIKRYTNRALLRTIRDMIGREGTESSILRMLDLVIEDTKN